MRRIAAGLVVVLCVLIALNMWVDGSEPAPVILPEEPVVPLEPDETWIGVHIKSGSTFGKLMGERGLSASELRAAALEYYDLAKIRPDRDLQIGYKDGVANPVAVRYRIDGDTLLLVRQTAEGWRSTIEKVIYTSRVGTRVVDIQRSLWQDGLAAGLSEGDLLRLSKVFEYELDFNTELRSGAKFGVVSEILEAPNRPTKFGDIYAVRLLNGGKTYEAVRFEVKDGEPNYYYPDGTSMRRPFLRSPLEFGRVTSSFNPKRFHPILKKTRPHNGVDFGAATGTRVRAVASGTVSYAGSNGGHGRFIKISHDGNVQTSYSHLSAILVRKGQRVQQGRIVGKVGATGLATGPHLHYQMWKGGRYVDPMKTVMPRAKTLPSFTKADFKAAVDKWIPRLP
jgi:murein DD-endopeptidase MepM/ murein hydrolase activator NlpD